MKTKIMREKMKRGRKSKRMWVGEGEKGEKENRADLKGEKKQGKSGNKNEETNKEGDQG